MPIVWSDKFLTNVESIDEQHRLLIAALNRLESAMRAERGGQEIGALLDFLDNYVATHFSHEEDCMFRHHCALAERNRLAHALFTQRFRDLRLDYERGGASMMLMVRLEGELMKWLEGHILGVDHELRTCASQPEEAPPPA